MSNADGNDPSGRRLNRRDWLRTVGFGGLMASTGAAGCTGLGGGASGPNVVLVMLDDAGLGDFGAYGGTAIETPNVDRMAASGVQCSQAYAGSAVCAPSRSTLFEGRHAGNTTVRANGTASTLDPSQPSLSSVLSEAGYAVGGFGKWGLGNYDTPGALTNNGFEEFFGYYDQTHAHDYYPDVLVHNGEAVEPSGYSHYEIVDRTLGFIEDHQDEPFFCFAPWTPPHTDFEIPDDDPAWQEWKDVPWPENAKRRAAMIQMVDRQMGELRAKLRELGIAKETLLLFTSDHGPNAGLYDDDATIDADLGLRGHKRSMYEGGLRVPFVAEWPGTIEAGTELDLPFYFPDLFPTLADVAGATDAVPDDIHGQSVASALRDPASAPDSVHDFMYWEFWDVVNWNPISYDPNEVPQAVRVGDWKIVRTDQSAPWELYNVVDDPREVEDRAGDRPKTVDRLRQTARRERSIGTPEPGEPGIDGLPPA